MRRLPALWLGWALGGPLVGGIACKAKEAPPIAEPWSDDFERAELGPLWRDTGGDYRIVGGRVNVKGAYNHPLWLRKKLPRDVVIEVDVMSKSDAGDIKIEPFGDGESYDPDKGGYVSTGYMLIFGGWGNTLNVICRNNEHDEGRKSARREPKVEPGRVYRWTVTRKGGLVDWMVDGQPFLSWTDREPLAGPGHEYLAFNNWESDVFFDNVRIRPAP